MALKEHIKSFMQEGKQYLDAKSEQLKLEVVEESINISSALLGWFVVFSMGLICVAILGITGVLAIAQLTESYLTACLIVSGIFITIFLLLYFFNKKLLFKPIKNYLLGMYLTTVEKDNHDKH